MPKKSSVAFTLSTVFKILVTSFCAFWPLWNNVEHSVIELYSLGNSVLDVWAAGLVQSLANIICLGLAAKPKTAPFSRIQIEPKYRAIARWLYGINVLFELCVLAKAIVVAILGKEVILPDPRNPQIAGLACIYSSIIGCLLCAFIESSSSRTLLRQWRREFRRNQRRAIGDTDDMLRPLLSPADKAVQLGGEEEEDIDDYDKRSTERKGTVKALLCLAAHDTPILIAAFTAGAIAALGQALIPYFTGRIIDYASIEPNRKLLVDTTIQLLIVALGCAVFTGFRGGLFTLSMCRLNVRLRKRLFKSLLYQDVGFFDLNKTGELSSRLSSDTSTVSDQISLNLNVMLRSSMQAAMVLAFMFHSSWRLTVVTFVIVPLVVAVSKVYGSYYRKMAKKVQAELAQANGCAEEALSSITTVKAHAAEASTEVAYGDKLEEFYKLMKREALAYAAYMTCNTYLSAAVTGGILFYGGTLVLDHAMSAGALVSFMLYQQSLTGAFQSLGDVFSSLSAAVGAADKVVELMQRPPAFSNDGALVPYDFLGKITLDNVDFSYPARPNQLVLSGFSLQVAPGQIVALVGQSGSGKSSVVKLVQRFYLPSAGRVLIDDMDVAVFEPKWLRQRVAFVSQEPVLYARSIKRNILYGLEAADGTPPHEIPTEEDIESAARLANAHDFICALPQGYDTECGERGVQLSGGQKQRIAIARALIRRPSCLLLDEATSALDSDSEAAVQEALDRTMAGRTVLVIAHRLSTVQDAHKIVVVMKGKAVEQGTHDQLLEHGGSYAQLVRRQLQRAASSAADLNVLASR